MWPNFRFPGFFWRVRTLVNAIRAHLAHSDAIGARRSLGQNAKAAELLRVGRRCKKLLKRAPIDHGRLLYDETGLPR
jgi:hypothetical protein